MVTRREQLGNLIVGDIVHATGIELFPSQICIITSITEQGIQARSATTQLHFIFDRMTGEGTGDYEGDSFASVIDSIAPLPVEIYYVILGLDRKFRLEADPERLKLTEDERRALIFVATYYPERPLPP